MFSNHIERPANYIQLWFFTGFIYSLPAILANEYSPPFPQGPVLTAMGLYDNQERPINFTGVSVIFVVPFDYMLREQQFHVVRLGWLERHLCGQTRCPANCHVHGAMGICLLTAHEDKLNWTYVIGNIAL